MRVQCLRLFPCARYHQLVPIFTQGTVSLCKKPIWKQQRRFFTEQQLPSSGRSGRSNRMVRGSTNDRVHTGDGFKDPLLPPVKDPRMGTVIHRASGGRNSESFDPASTFVRPSLRVQVVGNTPVYPKPLKNDDVVICPEFFCKEGDREIYYKLVEEMKALQEEGQKDSDWIPWHEGCHLISQNPKGCPTYEMILKRCCEFFNMREARLGTRFNWYRDSQDWKPFHHDSAAFNPHRAKSQNITVGISFGAERELAFLHAENGSRVYFPQANGMLFSFGRDVNINWKHGLNALPKDQHDGKGRISIILWGLIDAIEEEGSPPLLTNDTRNGFDNRPGAGGMGGNNHTASVGKMCRDFQRTGHCRFGDNCRFSHKM